MVHEHHFGQAEPKGGEARTRIVVALTSVFMVVEVLAGLAFGSMALLAIESQSELHSNDVDFARFPGLRWRNPLR